LSKLTHIATRIHKVDDIIDDRKEINNIKHMAMVDKARLGYKPVKGESQYSRECQNSGKDKRRRPQQYSSKDMSDLIKKGYYLNKKIGQYEKQTFYKGKNGKKIPVTLKTIKVNELNDDGDITGNEIHYACNPEDNGEHFYIGFLTKSTNSSGQCKPCCFKKDPALTQNKKKLEFLQRCMNQQESSKTEDIQQFSGDKLYILQDTNKIHDGRLGFLQKYLDIYLNDSLNNDKKIKHHYLMKTNGYFFKYGSDQSNYSFLNAVSVILNLTFIELKEKIISFLLNDKLDTIFTSLNNGNIKSQFETKENFISYIKNSDYIGYDSLEDIISIPGCCLKNGLTYVIFEKKNIITTSELYEKEKIREDFTIINTDLENVENLKNPQKEVILMVKEDAQYYPIVMVTKKSENDKNIEIKYRFKYGEDQVVDHINEFYEHVCIGSFMDTVIYKNSSLTAKKTQKILKTFKGDYDIRYQTIDVKNKCRYLITKEGIIIPVRPSGTLFNVQIIKSVDKYITDFNTTFKQLEELYNKTDKQLHIKPIGVYYDYITKDEIMANGIMTDKHNIVRITPIKLNIDELKKNKIIFEHKPHTDKIDTELAKGKSNYIVDQRITSVNMYKYKNESYELFRFEFSEYINRKENLSLRTRLLNIIATDSKKMHRYEKSVKIKLFMYRLVNVELYNEFKNMVSEVIDNVKNSQSGGKYDKFINITNTYPLLDKYVVHNDRVLCSQNNKDACTQNIHCHLTQNGCYMSLPKDMFILFVNMITEELILNDVKAFELLHINGMSVSDIVDQQHFKERPGQKIIRSTDNNINKIVNKLIKNNTSAQILKKNPQKIETHIEKLQLDNPLNYGKTYYSQKIIENNITLYRAYVNGYYWYKNNYDDISGKTLGYYSQIQTNLAIYFKTLVNEWLMEKKNNQSLSLVFKQYADSNFVKNIQDPISKNNIDKYILEMTKNINDMTNCVIELHILSQINKIPIVVYNNHDKLLYIFDDGLKYDSKNKSDDSQNKSDDSQNKSDDSKNKDYLNSTVTINLKFYLSDLENNIIPYQIDVIHFK
jgi:hypothetical protein